MRKEIIGNATLYQGDCLEVLSNFGTKEVDAVVTDPPYGLNIEYNSYDDTRENLESLVSGLFDYQDIWGRALIFSGPSQIHDYPRPKWVCSTVWNTTGSRGFCGFSQWTPILFYGEDVGGGFKSNNGKLKSDVIQIKGGAGVGFMRNESIDHPCPKPLNIMNAVIARFTKAGETVLDPFMGSGTTGVACMGLDCDFIGIELDEKYFDIACRRIEQAQRQLRLFEAS